MGAVPARRHRLTGHTADMGLRAVGPDLTALFEEAALALAEASADTDGGSSTGPRADGGRGCHGAEVPVALAADDLPALAYAWLNELIGLAGARGEALAGTLVRSVEETVAGWRIRARASFQPYATGAGPGARARLDVKSATFHRLAVRRAAGGWELTAYLDV